MSLTPVMPSARRRTRIGRAAMLTCALATVATVSPARAQTPADIDLSAMQWRSIGPAVVGGRVSDIAVVESEPATFYVGTATGGVWKTTSHGAAWEPIFDDQATSSIGDVTVAPSNPNIVWVGTGEPQNRQSSPWGAGVYRSTDAGRTWQFKGLEETRHIARIVIDPRNPDIVWVAAVGHLWGPNDERGVFRSTDGGDSWEKVLFENANTGAIDLVMDPGDPETLFAALYQRRRTACCFNGGGPGSGIYRTTDGGRTWTRLSKGLPTTEMGRIGLDIYRRDGNRVIAAVEAVGGNGVYGSTDRGETWEKLSDTNPRPMYFSQIRIDPNDPQRVYLGAQSIWVSDDGGRTFASTGSDGVHPDQHALWIDPNNSSHILSGNDGGISVSFDRAKTWRMYDNLPLAQFYEIGLDMRDPYWVCGGLQDNGSWCGPSDTRSNQGIRNADWFNVGGGDGFYAQMDPTDHTIVYAESQNGNMSRIDLNTGERVSIRPVERPRGPSAASVPVDSVDYRWNWNTPLVVSTHDPARIYLGANVLFASDDRGASWRRISPDLTKQIDRDTIAIMGVKPTNRMLSRHDGVTSYGNITTISESPLKAGLVYIGTDDGNVQVTRDGGATWTNITRNFPGVPARTYVSRVLASRAGEGIVYATFDNHYHDDYAAYVYMSRDYGKSWKRITQGLPHWSINVIAQHPRTPSLLFAGSEVGIHFSTDAGEHWEDLDSNLPTVPVDAIVVHPRDNDLVIGTHGRGIWILPDISPLEHLAPAVLAEAAHLFPVEPATIYNDRGTQAWVPAEYSAQNRDFGAFIRYWLKNDLTTADGGDAGVRLTILDAQGGVVRSLKGTSRAGINQLIWDLRIAPAYEVEEGDGGGFNFAARLARGPRVLPGRYSVRLEAPGLTQTTELEVLADSRTPVTAQDLAARQKAMMDAYVLAKPIYDAGRALDTLSVRIRDARTAIEAGSATTQALKDEAEQLATDVREAAQELNRVRGFVGAGSSIESRTAPPTEDQLWQIEEAWRRTPGVLARINELIVTRGPAFMAKIYQPGVAPAPIPAVAIPRR